MKSSSLVKTIFTGLIEFHREDGAAEDRAVELELAAEAASHVRREHPDVAFSHAEDAGHKALHIVGRLVGGINGQFLVGGVARYRAAGLHAHVRLAAAAEPVFPDVLRFLEAFFDLAPFDMAGNADVPLEAVMDLGGVFLYGVKGLENRGEHLIVDLDQVEGLFRDLFRYRRDCRNRLADIADLVDGQYLLVAQVLVAPPDALFHAEGILARHHCPYAVEGQGLAGVDALDLCVGVGAPEYLAVEHAGELDVEGVGGPARDLRPSVDVMDVCIDYPERLVRIDYGIFVHALSSVYLPLATESIARTMLLYPVHRQMFPSMPSLISFSVGFLLSFRNATDDMSMPEVQKPHWKAPSSRNAFWIGWSLPFTSSPSEVIIFVPSRLDGEHGAALYRHAVDDDRACAAGDGVAAPLGARKLDVVPDGFHEKGLRVYVNLIILIVHVEM